MSKKQEIALSISGHEYDKELSRVPIKVSPALQALVANQLELMEKVEKCYPEESITLEQLKLELIQVEEEIAFAFSKYTRKRDEQRVKREQRKQELESIPSPVEELPPFIDVPLDIDPSFSNGTPSNFGDDTKEYIGQVNQEAALEAMAEKLSPGLPSQNYEPRSQKPEQPVEVDLRRVAIGASIKALENFLKRRLSEDEIVSLEQQIESYLV